MGLGSITHNVDATGFVPVGKQSDLVPLTPRQSNKRWREPARSRLEFANILPTRGGVQATAGAAPRSVSAAKLHVSGVMRRSGLIAKVKVAGSNPVVRSKTPRCATFVGTILVMPTVSIRELANNASGVVASVAETGRPAIVTKHGRPVAAVVPIDQEELEDFVLANAPEFVAGRHQADADLAAGRTRSIGKVLADLDDDD